MAVRIIISCKANDFMKDFCGFVGKENLLNSRMSKKEEIEGQIVAATAHKQQQEAANKRLHDYYLNLL
jgi:hypothetical protein